MGRETKAKRKMTIWGGADAPRSDEEKDPSGRSSGETIHNSGFAINIVGRASPSPKAQCINKE